MVVDTEKKEGKKKNCCGFVIQIRFYTFANN